MKRTTTYYLILSLLFSSVLKRENNLNGQNIITIAGNGGVGYSGDGGPATAATFYYPRGAAIDKAGNLYIADGSNNVIRMINLGDTISTFAGNGTAGYSGDGGLATNASFNYPYALATDASGNVYICDVNNSSVRKIDRGDTITTIAGNGTTGYSGDSGFATAAELNAVHGVAVDRKGNIYLADYGNNRIRKINDTGMISTIAGNGTAGFSGDSGMATAAEISSPIGIAVDSLGNIYIADYGNERIRKINDTGMISTIAGNGNTGYTGDGGPATSAEMFGPITFALDDSGNIYFSDVENNAVRKIDRTGIISTIAGNGSAGFSGDGGLATAAQLYWPEGLAKDSKGNIYISEVLNCRSREIPIPLTATTDSVINICKAGNLGSIKVTPEGGRSPYTYSWSNGQTSASATGLTSGSYTVTIKDMANYMAQDTASIIEPPVLTVSPLATPTTVCSGTPAILAINAAGGTNVYTYSWSTGATTSTLSVSPDSGTTYSFIVMDKSGCTYDSSVRVNTLPTPTVSLSITKDTMCINFMSDALMGTPLGGTFSGAGVVGSNFDANIAGVGTHAITYTYTAVNGCSNSSTVNALVNACTGIDPLNAAENGVEVYPNPFNQSIDITIDASDPVTIDLYTMIGQNISYGLMKQGSHIINTGSLPSGIYMMQVKTNNGVFYKKLTKVNQ